MDQMVHGRDSLRLQQSRASVYVGVCRVPYTWCEQQRVTLLQGSLYAFIDRKGLTKFHGLIFLQGKLGSDLMI